MLQRGEKHELTIQKLRTDLLNSSLRRFIKQREKRISPLPQKRDGQQNTGTRKSVKAHNQRVRMREKVVSTKSEPGRRGQEASESTFRGAIPSWWYKGVKHQGMQGRSQNLSDQRLLSG